MDFINKISIKARVAFYIAIAEKLFEQVNQNVSGYTQAREALDHCWSWLEGKAITGDELYEYLENEQDTGLMVFGYYFKNDPINEPIWKIIITSLMYNIWQAYQIENERYLPQTIEDVDETIIDDFMRYIDECQTFNRVWVDLLINYLIENYGTSNTNGNSAILKNEVMQIIQGACL